PGCINGEPLLPDIQRVPLVQAPGDWNGSTIGSPIPGSLPALPPGAPPSPAAGVDPLAPLPPPAGAPPPGDGTPDPPATSPGITSRDVAEPHPRPMTQKAPRALVDMLTPRLNDRSWQQRERRRVGAVQT